MIKICAKCGNEFIPQKITSRYCSRDCYLAANKERATENRKHQHAKAKIQDSPSKSDFDLKEGDIIYGPDRQLDGSEERAEQDPIRRKSRTKKEEKRRRWKSPNLAAE